MRGSVEQWIPPLWFVVIDACDVTYASRPPFFPFGRTCHCYFPRNQAITWYFPFTLFDYTGSEAGCQEGVFLFARACPERSRMGSYINFSKNGFSATEPTEATEKKSWQDNRIIGWGGSLGRLLRQQKTIPRSELLLQFFTATTQLCWPAKMTDRNMWYQLNRS